MKLIISRQQRHPEQNLSATKDLKISVASITDFKLKERNNTPVGIFDRGEGAHRDVYQDIGRNKSQKHWR